VIGVANITFTTLLEKIPKNEYEIKYSSRVVNTQVEIELKTFVKYTLMIKELYARNTDFHTYKMKDERSFKVVLKNIHPSINLEELKQNIKAIVK
jgi:hypothetical protein